MSRATARHRVAACPATRSRRARRTACATRSRCCRGRPTTANPQMQPPAGGPGLRGFRRGPQTPPGTAPTSWLPSTTTGISERTVDSISPAPSGARQPQLRSCSQKSPTCTNTSQPSWAAVLSAAFMTSGCCGCHRAASRCPQPRQTPRRHRPRLARSETGSL